MTCIFKFCLSEYEICKVNRDIPAPMRKDSWGLAPAIPLIPPRPLYLVSAGADGGIHAGAGPTQGWYRFTPVITIDNPYTQKIPEECFHETLILSISDTFFIVGKRAESFEGSWKGDWHDQDVFNG